MPTFSPAYREVYESISSIDIAYQNPNTNLKQINKLVFDLAATCNMGCSYCFADEGKYGDDAIEQPLMSVETAEAILDKIVQYCSSIGHIKFFGGEPLLAFDAITAVCLKAKESVEADSLTALPSYNIITNGTVFSDAISESLRSNEIRMTVSIDGPQDIHDSQRVLLNGKGTFDRITKNVDRFHKGGCRLGVLESVYTPKHLIYGYSMLDIYKYFEDRFKGVFETIVIHPVDQPTLNSIADSSIKEKYIESMRKQSQALYSHIAYYDSARMRSMVSTLSAKQRDKNLCGVGYDTVTVKPDGSVYSCYVFSGESEHSYTNILNDSFWDKFGNGKASQVMEVASRFKHDACNACDIQPTCTHCLSGMNSTSGLNDLLPDINCSFNIGQIEGLFDALSLHKNQGTFEKLCGN